MKEVSLTPAVDATDLVAASATQQRLRHTVIPLALLMLCPPAVGVLWFTHVKLGGSVAALAQLITERGFFATIAEIWAPLLFGTPTAWAMLGTFIACQMALMRLLPGARF